MKQVTKRLLACLVVMATIGFATTTLAADPPVATLMQVQGQVEFSKDGTTWKPVARNKFLFAGDMIRTGADGAGQLVGQSNGQGQAVGANSVIRIAAQGGEVVSGSLSKPEPVAGDLVAGLSNRFAEAQRYTTVRRATKKEGEVSLKTVSKVTLSATYPDLVWSNVGPQYSYKVTLDGKSMTVAGGKDDPIRHRISGLSAGKHTFRIAALEGDKVISQATEDSEIVWLSDAEDAAIKKSIERIKTAAPGDEFAVGSFLDEKGLTVAAMDAYVKYFSANKDDNDMRPLLIKAYHDLKLKDLKSAEAELYNKMMNSN